MIIVFFKKKKQFNDYLTPKIFIVTNHVTIADFYLFTKLYHRVCDMTDTEKGGKFVHFFRWYVFFSIYYYIFNFVIIFSYKGLI